jgi:hypothetical protein
MNQDANRPLAAAAGALLTFLVGVSLVAGRSALHTEITVLLLALSVVVAGRFGGRAGGLASALMAATTFDFFHTKPYLSLKISSGDDIAVTFVLLAVGVVAGDLSARAARDRRVATTREIDADAISRILRVARDRSLGDVEFAVRTELVQLLTLKECRFTDEPTDLPEFGPNGSLDVPHLVHRDDGFELPPGGVAIDVSARGQRLGSLVCVPEAGVGVGITRRKTAVVAGHILGLAIVASGPATRRSRS